MIKTAEQEIKLKLAIRDCIARNPLMTVVQLQNALKERGFQTAQGNPLDWRYVAKLLRKLERERALAVDQQKIQDRLAITKEKFRLMTERLWKIIDWRLDYIEEGIGMPQTQDVIRAINTVVKLDLAILKAEMDAGIFDRKLGTLDVNLYRAIPLEPEKAAQIAHAFQLWGINLTLPEKSKAIEQRPDATAIGRQGVPTSP